MSERQQPASVELATNVTAAERLPIKARLRQVAPMVYVIEVTNTDWSDIQSEILLSRDNIAAMVLDAMKPFVFQLR